MLGFFDLEEDKRENEESESELKSQLESFFWIRDDSTIVYSSHNTIIPYLMHLVNMY